MSTDHYLVVFRDPYWEVSHRGNVEGPFRSREDALQSAIAAAAADGQNGVRAEVRVQEDQSREFRTAWTWGEQASPSDGQDA